MSFRRMTTATWKQKEIPRWMWIVAVLAMIAGLAMAKPRECREQATKAECVACCVEGGQKLKPCEAICKNLRPQHPSDSVPR